MQITVNFEKYTDKKDSSTFAVRLVDFCFLLQLTPDQSTPRSEMEFTPMHPPQEYVFNKFKDNVNEWKEEGSDDEV